MGFIDFPGLKSKTLRHAPRSILGCSPAVPSGNYVVGAPASIAKGQVPPLAALGRNDSA